LKENIMDEAVPDIILIIIPSFIIELIVKKKEKTKTFDS